MTIQGVIKELDILIDSEDIPLYYKPGLRKIKETVMMECENMKNNKEMKEVITKLDRAMECTLESDPRSFSNPECESDWFFDHIIEWRKMFHPYIKD